MYFFSDTLFLEDFSLPGMISQFEEHIKKDPEAALVSCYTCKEEGEFLSYQLDST